MTDPEILGYVQHAMDLSRSGLQALEEKLAEKIAPGSYLTLLSKVDRADIAVRREKLMQEYRAEREKARTGLVLPPGVSP